MGNDYQLKKIYEQMVKGEVTPSTPQKPRTLSEAYSQKLVTETIAFYASKEMKDGGVGPEYSALTKLGDIDDKTASVLRNTILSQSINKEATQLLEIAGWSNTPTLTPSMIGLEITNSTIPKEDVQKIITHKKDLTALADAIQATGRFNFKEKILSQLGSKFSELFDTLYNIIPNVGMSSVGRGEVAGTLLTNGVKPKGGGDIDFGPGMRVELKGSHAPIGKAPWAVAHTSRELAKILKTLSKATPLSRASLRDMIDNISTMIETIFEPVKQYFNEEYEAKLKRIPTLVTFDKYDPTSFATQFERMIEEEHLVPVNSLDIKSPDLFFNAHHYLHKLSNNGDVHLSQTDINKIKEFCATLKKQTTKLKTYFKNRQVSTIDPNELAAESYAEVVPSFFLGNTQLDLDQLANAFVFTRTYDESSSISNADLEQEIKELLNSSYGGGSYYEALTNKNRRALEAIIFGITLKVYATKVRKSKNILTNFDYFLIVNNDSKNAFSIKVEGQNVKQFADVYTNEKDLHLTIVAKNDPGGASVINFNA